MTEYSREAQALARTMAPDGDWHLDEWRIAVRIAQRAIDAGWVQRDDLIAQGWTPPADPDPVDDVVRLAGMLRDSGQPLVANTPHVIAQHLLDQGVTLPDPPDVHEAIARELFAVTFPHWPDDGTVGDPLATTAGEHILDAVRRIPVPLARQVAEALRGES